MLIHGLSEFAGTSVLIGAIAFSGETLWIVLAFALAIFLTGPISGGHINPAVTLWAYLSHKITYAKAIHNVTGQFAAAVFVFGLHKYLKNGF